MRINNLLFFSFEFSQFKQLFRKYKFVIFIQTPDDIVDFNSEDNITLERQTLYCIPVPGENEWLKNVSF